LLKPYFVCTRTLGFCKNTKYKYLDTNVFKKRVLSDKPDFIKDNDYVNKQYEKIRNDTKPRKTIKVMHMTDIHVDLEYLEGTNAYCGDPI